MASTDGETEALADKYHEALERNRAAKTRLKEIIDQSSNPAIGSEQVQINKSVSTNESPIGKLNLTLDVLRLRKQHQRKQIIINHLNQAEQIAKQHGIYTMPKHRQLSGLSDVEDVNRRRSMARLQQDLDDLLDRSKQLTSSLEQELYKARQTLKHEQALLEQVRDEHKAGPVSEEGRLKGLEAAKNDLTSWIEGILSRCEEPVAESSLVASSKTNAGFESEGLPQTTPEDFQAAIADRYEQYLTARRELVGLAETLHTPRTPATSTSERASTAQAQEARLQNAGAIQADLASPFNTIERIHLPARTQSSILEAHLEHLRSEVAREQRDLASSLLRLSDESHLLPTYPLLANDAKFKNARSVFGQGDANSRRVEAREQRQTGDEKRIDGLLKAWRFASEAAESRCAETVSKAVEDGDRALLRARSEIEDMRMLRGQLEEFSALT